MDQDSPPALSSRLIALIDRAIAPRRVEQGGDELRRLRLIVVSLILALIFALPLTVEHIAAGHFLESVVLGVVALLAVPLLIAARLGAPSSIVGHGLGLMLITPSMINGPTLGGVFGPASLAFIGLPVLLTLMMGRRHGLPWCGLGILGTLLMAAQTAGAPEQIRIKTLALIGVNIFMTAIAYMFESLRRKAIAEAAAARDEAMAAAEAKSRFLANMSHEIRTPMNGVLGMLDVLLQGELEREQRTRAQTAHSSGMALLGILNDVLHYSKISAGRLSLELTAFDLRALVEEVLDQVAVAADDKGLELVARYVPGTPVQVVADRGRLRQILVNLVGNAVKFTDEGHVLVTVEHTERPDELPLFICSVQDTGIGIEADEQATIFDHFKQVDMSAARRHPGTGLGLSITRELVTLMEGTIEVQSEAQQGSTFRVVVPLAPVAKENMVRERQERLTRVRVLVVDDNDINRRVLKEQLTEYVEQLDACTSGPEALRLLKEALEEGSPYHMALLDYHMPHMDGLELAQAIKADPQLSEVVLVMLTAVTRQSLKPIREAGCFAHVVKPVHRAELLNTLTRAWEQYRGMSIIPAGPVSTSAEHDSAAISSAQHDARVLLVEDNLVNQKVAHALLTALGCEVDVANNGVEALEHAEATAYDVIFMDIQMPDMDGIEATKQLRRREENSERHVPIVAMTAHAMEDDRERCLAVGMDMYVSKPVQRTGLAKVLQECLSR